jgi:uncharacterized repeat protein (TIGR03803 family)
MTLATAALMLCAPAHGAPQFKVLHAFNGSDGSGPYGGATPGPGGGVYGTTAGGGPCGTVFGLSPQKGGQWTETVLYQFAANNDGCDPWSSVMFDREGNLYATTVGGGTHFSGTVFELTPNTGVWAETVIYDFCSLQNCDDGGSPTGGLIMDQAGNLYGTAHLVFELSHGSGDWKEKVLHRFTGEPGGSALIFDSSANLYGATSAGGVHHAGTVFEVQRASGRWKEQALHSFPAFRTDGQVPGGGALVFDGSGNLYGTTLEGGANICNDVGCGTIFRLTRGNNGHWKETILHNFKPGAGGSFPGGLVMDKAGNLYGVAGDGGGSCDCGVVYKLSPGSKDKWTYTVLHRFSGADGAIPAGNLTIDDKGNLYGGTVLGGTGNNGVIFELTP